MARRSLQGAPRHRLRDGWFSARLRLVQMSRNTSTDATSRPGTHSCVRKMVAARGVLHTRRSRQYGSRHRDPGSRPISPGGETLVSCRTPISLGGRRGRHPLVWIITIAITIAFFVFEFFAHVRKPHEPSIGESARWSAFYIGLALLFASASASSRWTFGGEYFAGYLTEKALSIDNLFVFLIIMTGFAVPKKYQQKVRAIDRHRDRAHHARCVHRRGRGAHRELLGSSTFGALLLFLAYRQAFSHGESDPPTASSCVSCAASCP